MIAIHSLISKTDYTQLFFNNETLLILTTLSTGINSSVTANGNHTTAYSKPDDNLNNGLFHANGHSDGQEHQQQMATENNLNNHNVHQEEKEDNLHDLDQGNLLRGIEKLFGCSSISSTSLEKRPKRTAVSLTIRMSH